MSEKKAAWKLTGLIALAGVAGFPLTNAPIPVSVAEQNVELPVRDLVAGPAVSLGVPAATIATFGSKCDSAGDIYILYSSAPVALSSGAMSEFPVSKISLNPMRITQYPVPVSIPDYGGRVFRFSFDVSADGTFYALLNTARREIDGKMTPAFLIAKYDSDGTIDSFHKLSQPGGEHFQPLRMAVLGHESFLLSGTTSREAGLGSWTGVFDGSGNFVHPLALEKSVARWENRTENSGSESDQPSTDNKGHQKIPRNPVSLESSTLSFGAPDGNTYLLQSSSQPTLYVVSSEGQILRHYQLQPPRPRLTPLQMAAAGPGFLFIDYGYVATGAPNENTHQASMIDVLKMETGEVTTVYRVPEEQGLALPACSSAPDRFTFLGASKDNQLTVLQYSAP